MSKQHTIEARLGRRHGLEFWTVYIDGRAVLMPDGIPMGRYSETFANALVARLTEGFKKLTVRGLVG